MRTASLARRSPPSVSLSSRLVPRALGDHASAAAPPQAGATLSGSAGAAGSALFDTLYETDGSTLLGGGMCCYCDFCLCQRLIYCFWCAESATLSARQQLTRQSSQPPHAQSRAQQYPQPLPAQSSAPQQSLQGRPATRRRHTYPPAASTVTAMASTATVSTAAPAKQQRPSCRSATLMSDVERILAQYNLSADVTETLTGKTHERVSKLLSQPEPKAADLLRTKPRTFPPMRH